MSKSNKYGTASLSKSQRDQLAQFRRRNFVMLKNLKVTEIVQIWRDGFICGAIHGFDQGVAWGAKKHCMKSRNAQKRRLDSRVCKKRGRGQS